MKGTKEGCEGGDLGGWGIQGSDSETWGALRGDLGGWGWGAMGVCGALTVGGCGAQESGTLRSCRCCGPLRRRRRRKGEARRAAAEPPRGGLTSTSAPLCCPLVSGDPPQKESNGTPPLKQRKPHGKIMGPPPNNMWSLCNGDPSSNNAPPQISCAPFVMGTPPLMEPPPKQPVFSL